MAEVKVQQGSVHAARRNSCVHCREPVTYNETTDDLVAVPARNSRFAYYWPLLPGSFLPRTVLVISVLAPVAPPQQLVPKAHTQRDVA